MVRSTARMSPSVLRYVWAMRSTSACGRIVGNEAARHLQRQVMRGLRAAREQVQHLFAVAHAAGVNLLAQDDFLFRIVHARH